MKQYLDLLQTIKDKGTHKPPARAGMPGSTSLFGYQFRHNLQDGFPLLTTKKISFKNIVVELLWFLRGDTNIKYLVDNGCNIWNEDAYNYYLKIAKRDKWEGNLFSYEAFISYIKTHEIGIYDTDWNRSNYKMGDCGYQYGKVWRKWHIVDFDIDPKDNGDSYHRFIDQIKNVVHSLKINPESRRHIVTAIDPAHDENLALYWCHAMFQFNCRPLTEEQKNEWLKSNWYDKAILKNSESSMLGTITTYEYNKENIPKYYLDCELYQRSADVFLGVPYNIASYALLIHIISKICNMIPGEFIHTFGDVHIYDNHMDQVNEQLTREPRGLPTLEFKSRQSGYEMHEELELDEYFKWLNKSNFVIHDYNPHPRIKAELSTGLKK